MLDIRVPIGLMFLVKGIILVIWGFISDPAMYRASLGVNINRDWGAAMLIFGIVMLALAKMYPEKLHEDGDGASAGTGAPRGGHH